MGLRERKPANTERSSNTERVFPLGSETPQKFGSWVPLAACRERAWLHKGMDTACVTAVVVVRETRARLR
jgi:hypothetical protein